MYDSSTKSLSLTMLDATKSSFLSTVLDQEDLSFSDAESCLMGTPARRSDGDNALKVVATFSLPLTTFGQNNTDAVLMILGTDSQAADQG